MLCQIQWCYSEKKERNARMNKMTEDNSRIGDPKVMTNTKVAPLGGVPPLAKMLKLCGLSKYAQILTFST